MKKKVVIVGAGLAGLATAMELEKKGIDYILLESGSEVGGRVRTIEKEGYLLDLGFQVFISAYPTAKKLLDYTKLDLRSFHPGASVRSDGKFQLVSDPLRRPQDAIATIFASIGTFMDKLRVLRLRRKLKSSTLDVLFTREDISTLEALRQYGFSEKMIEQFFRPFFSRVFLEDRLDTSRRMFDFIFKMFSSGDITIPAGGMQRIPEQMRDRLSDGRLVLNAKVKKIEDRKVILENGDECEAEKIVLATPIDVSLELVPALAKLIDRPLEWNSSISLYFTSGKFPLKEPRLILNADPGLINTVVAMSYVSDKYTSSDRVLLSVTTSPDAPKEDLVSLVKKELESWFSEDLDIEFLEKFDIKHSLPSKSHGFERRDPLVLDNVILVGDYVSYSGSEGALSSGVKAAELISNK